MYIEQACFHTFIMKGLITMLFSIISAALNNLFFFALHVENYSVFPKPLSRKEEAECFESMAKGRKMPVVS